MKLNIKKIITNGVPIHAHNGYKNGFGMLISKKTGVKIYSTYEPCEPIANFLGWQYAGNKLIILETLESLLITEQGNVVAYMNCNQLESIEDICDAWQNHQWDNVKTFEIYQKTSTEKNIERAYCECRIAYTESIQESTQASSIAIITMIEKSEWNNYEISHIILDDDNAGNINWAISIALGVQLPDLFLYTKNGYMYKVKGTIEIKTKLRDVLIWHNPKKKIALIRTSKKFKTLTEFREEKLIDISKLIGERKKIDTSKKYSARDFIKLNRCKAGILSHCKTSPRKTLNLIAEKEKIDYKVYLFKEDIKALNKTGII